LPRLAALALVAALSLLASSGTARAAAAFVTSGSGTSSSTSISASYGATTQSNHLLVAVLQTKGASAAVTNSDSNWTKVPLTGAVDATSGVGVWIWYYNDASGSGGHTAETFTLSGSTSTVLQVAEFSGIVTSSPLDVYGATTIANSTSITAAVSSPTTQGPELAIGAFGTDGASNGNSDTINGASAPFTNIGGVGDIAGPSSSHLLGTYDATVTAGSSLSETIGTKKSDNIAGALATFKVAVQTYYWRGNGGYAARPATPVSGTCYGFFDDGGCWSTTSGGATGTAAPGTNDNAIFDGVSGNGSTGNGNCTVSPLAGGTTTVNQLTVQSGYSGTITQSTALTTFGSLTLSGGTFATSATAGIDLNASGSYAGDLAVSGGTFTGNGAAVNVRNLTVSSGSTFNAGSSVISTKGSGTATFSGGTVSFGSGGASFAATSSFQGATVTFGTGGVTFTGTPTMSSGGVTFGGGTVGFSTTSTLSGATVAFGSGATTFTGLPTMSGGTVTLGTGTLTFSAGLTVSGAGVTFPSRVTAPTFNGTLTVSAGTVNLTNGTANPDLSLATVYTQSGGTVNLNGAQLTTGAGLGVTDGFSMTGGTFNAGTGTLIVGATSSGTTTTINGSGAIFSDSGGAETFNGELFVTSGSMTLGNAKMNSNRGGNPNNVQTDHMVVIGAGGTLTLGTTKFAFDSTNAMTVSGTLNVGGGGAEFTPAVTLASTGIINAGGTTGNSTTFDGTLASAGAFNALAATSVVFTGAYTQTASTATFNGGTGSGEFKVAETIANGTFTVGATGTTGKWTFDLAATFSNGTTLAFPSSGGELSMANNQTLSVAGTILASTSGSTLPKIDCPGCAAGFTMQLTGQSTLNINGLQFDKVSTSGVQIADPATFTSFQRVKFTNNAAGSTASGTHLAITHGSIFLVAPGCYFDNTAKVNVALVGTSASPGIHAIFESYNGNNGARAGESWDSDSDTNDDNVGDGAATTTPFLSVVEWAAARPTDTAGTAIGFPTAAFDWNTFAYYGVYAEFQDTSGSSTADVLWMRNADGSAAYSYAVPQTSGDLKGNPYWDTINEVTSGLDVDGDGVATNTHVHIVYLTTDKGHIIKLIDDGTKLAPPASGKWSTDFFDTSTVASISSPVAFDGTNLYFSGTDGTSSHSPTMFGLQVTADSGHEKTIQRSVGILTTTSTVPSWASYSGTTYVFAGSTSPAAVARIDMTGATVPSNFTASAAVNASMAIVSNVLYAVTNDGNLYGLDASNFTSGGFKNVTGTGTNPLFSTGASKPIGGGPWVDASASLIYLADDGGSLYVVTTAGALYQPHPPTLTKFPFTVSSGHKLSKPLYRSSSGVIAVGADDGYVYFVDRDSDGAGTPKIFKRFFVTSSGQVSAVAYDSGASIFMVSSSDGKLMFINAVDVTDPTTGST
jgi:hypothetical protein